MKKTFNILKYTFASMLLLFFISSCSNKRFLVAPEFTNVEKIIQLEEEMTVKKVNEVLGILPYDAYNLDLKNLILSYNYRLKKRRLPVTNRSNHVNMYKDPENKTVNSEAAQKGGSLYYADWKQIYISFYDGKLVGYISDNGLERTNKIEIIKGSIFQSRSNKNIKIIDKDMIGDTYFLDKDGNIISQTSEQQTGVVKANIGRINYKKVINKKAITTKEEN